MKYIKANEVPLLGETVPFSEWLTKVGQGEVTYPPRQAGGHLVRHPAGYVGLPLSSPQQAEGYPAEIFMIIGYCNQNPEA